MSLWSSIKKGVRKVESAGKSVVKKVEREGDSAIHQIEKEANKHIDRLKKYANRGVDEISKTGVRIGKEIEDGAEEAIAKIESEVPKLAEMVLKEIQDGLWDLWSSGVVDKIVDIVQESAVPEQVTPIRLSFLEFNVNLHDKIDVLQELSHNLPSNREEIIDMILKLVDDDVVIIHIDARLITSTLGFDFADLISRYAST